MVPSANHAAPSHATSPKWRRARRAKRSAATTALTAPTTIGPAAQASGGNSTL